MKFEQGFAHAFIVVGIIAILVGALGVVLWKNFSNATNATLPLGKHMKVKSYLLLSNIQVNGKK